MNGLLCGVSCRPEETRAGRDTALMAKAGFNTVNAVLSPATTPAALGRLLEKAREQGLRALVTLPEGDCPKKLLQTAVSSDAVIGFRLTQDAQREALTPLLGPDRFALRLPDVGTLDGPDMALHAARARARGKYVAFGVPVCGPRGELPSPGRLTLAALTHIADGAKGVIFERFHSETGGAYAPGPLGWDGRPGEIFEECQKAAGELSRLTDRLSGLRKRVRAALLLSRPSRTLWDALYGEGIYERRLRALAGSLYRLNVEYDFLWDDDAALENFNLIAAPALCAVSDGFLEALCAFVERGGGLLTGGRTGFADEKLTPRTKTKALAKLLGFTSPGTVEAQDAPLRSRTVTLPEGAALTGTMELLRPAGAAVLVAAAHPERGDLPAVTVNAYGRGRCAYLAAPLPPEALDQVIDALLRALRIPLPGIRAPLILRRASTGEGRDLIFFLNHSPRPHPLPFGGDLPPWGVQVRENGRIL